MNKKEEKNIHTKKLIELLVNQYAEGSNAEFARLINKSRKWVGDKRSGRHGITFENVVEICKSLEIKYLSEISLKL